MDEEKKVVPKGIATNVQCTKCGRLFQTNKENLKYQESFRDESGRSYLLSYVDCPNCGDRNFVQADNGDTISLLRDVKKDFSKLAAQKAKHMTISKKQLIRFEKERQHLSESRIKLIDKIDGSLLKEVSSDKEFEVRFNKCSRE